MELVRQGDIEQFEKETKLFHFEFTSICNQHCSYCLEGNFNPDKPKDDYSMAKDLLGTLDKIFKAYDEDIMLGFILVGGEPTLQTYFIDVVNKIKSRKNAFQVLTTNFSQSIEYYKELDIPLVTSMHLDSQEPEAWLEKTLALKDLVAHTRIMAHPQKMEKVIKTYNLFMEASKTVPLSFAVEEIFDFTINVKNFPIDYKANYSKNDLDFVRNCKPVDCTLSESLNNKLGILKNMFYRSQWYCKDEKGEITVKMEDVEKNNFKNFFCERSMIIIRADGHLAYGWGCYESSKNIYKNKTFPKHEVKTVVCQKACCPLSMGSTIPKYKNINYAPDYAKKPKLIALKIINAPILVNLHNITVKTLACFIPLRKYRRKFRNKFSMT